MRFEHPQLLWLLLAAVPLLAGFFWWTWRQKRALMQQFIAPRLLAQLTVGLSPTRQKARLVLLTAAVALILTALARPQFGFGWEEVRSRGLDVVVAIDTSRSMLASDVVPNRLARAKIEALNLKKLARADRIGLVAFAGSAFLQCPLTLDDEVFRQSIEALDVNIIPQGGTVLSEAMAAAKSAFKDDNDNHKALVILTDGEDHDGTAVDAAKEAAKEGMTIFTIGVGTPNGEMLRLADAQGRTEFIKDDEGNAVKSRLNETLLREIAEATRGFYMRLSGANTMNLLYERGLAPMPKSDRAAQQVKRYNERYQWLLGLGLALLLVEMLMPERKKLAPPPATNGSGLKPAATVILLLLTLFTPARADLAKEARLQYDIGEFGEAQLEYERMAMKKTNDLRLRFNAGTAAFQAKHYEEALTHLNAALTTPDLRLQQAAYYNLGNTQFRLGEAVGELTNKLARWEASVKSYRSAVALRTNDLDASFNLGFVAQKVAEVRALLLLLEEARQAKAQAEAERRRRNYGKAAQTLEAALARLQGQKQDDPLIKEITEQLQKLQAINEIATSPQ